MKVANKDGFRWGENAYLIGHEFGLICVSYGSHEQEAIDNAADEGFMDSERMSDADHAEYDSKGWHDSFLYAGNASEPFWNEHLWVKLASDRKGQAMIQ